jgi:aconitase B
MLKAYRDHVAERAALGIPPLPLSAKQTGELIELLKNPPKGEEATLVGFDYPPRACGCGRCGEGQSFLPRGSGTRH